jgi:hypothetical protein
MRTDHRAVVSVAALLLVVLVGHVCPLGARTFEHSAPPPAPAPHGPGGHHDHHDTHLSTCLPGAILPDSGAPIAGTGVTAESGAAAMASVAIAAMSVTPEAKPDPPRLKPPLYLLHTVLLI